MGRLHITQSRRAIDASAHDASVADFAAISRRVSADLRGGATFVVVTGAANAGRSQLCELVVKNAGPRSFPLAIATVPSDVDVLMEDMLQRFGCLGNPGRNTGSLNHDDLVTVMRRFLRSMSSLHGQVLLIFDDAHQLKPHFIEQLHALTTFQPDGHAVLQVVLAGEPPLIEMLGADDRRDIAPTISRRYRLLSFEPPRAPRRVDTRHAASMVSRWWFALGLTPALIIVAFTGSWAIQHDIVFSSPKPANDPGNRASSGYLSPEISSPAKDTRPTGTFVKTDHRVVRGGSASAKPADLPKELTLDEILVRAAAFAAEPDVKALVRLHEEVANRIPHSTDDAEREAIASTLKSLDRTLEKARRLQLQIDGQRLAGRGARRAATDAPPSQ